MTGPDETDGTRPTGPTDPEAIKADIEQTRNDLADTVDQLTNKLDVKAQAGQRVTAAKSSVTDKVAQARAAAPPPIQHAVDAIGEKAGPVVHRVTEQARPHRSKIALGVGALLVVVVITRRVRRNRSSDRR